jgi:hypothetical protein
VSNGNGATTCPQQPLPYPLDLATFRTMWTAFADPTAYSDATVQVWLDIGCNMVNCNWGPAAGFGQGLFAAHELAKFAQAAQQAASGNLSGISGPPQSKSVGPVSVSYDLRLGYDEAAGPYNNTIYGQQYFRLAQLYGTGPLQIGAASLPTPWGSGIGWTGPPLGWWGSSW